ncbi:hypothetical protein V8C35DRAFT_312088 [Trichoderma chlorosporum]
MFPSSFKLHPVVPLVACAFKLPKLAMCIPFAGASSIGRTSAWLTAVMKQSISSTHICTLFHWPSIEYCECDSTVKLPANVYTQIQWDGTTQPHTFAVTRVEDWATGIPEIVIM